MMRAILLASVFLAGLALAACGDDAPRSPPAEKAKPAAQKKAAKDEGAAGENQPVVAAYSYTPIGKRDPFRSFFDTFEPAAPTVRRETECGPLCQWELDQLKLVAIVSGVASPLAMLEDPEGRGHMVRRGSYIGKRDGKVSEIHRDRVVVTELLRNQQGQVLPIKTEIPLRTEKSPDAPGNEMIDLSMANGG